MIPWESYMLTEPPKYREKLKWQVRQGRGMNEGMRRMGCETEEMKNND